MFTCVFEAREYLLMTRVELNRVTLTVADDAPFSTPPPPPCSKSTVQTVSLNTRAQLTYEPFSKIPSSLENRHEELSNTEPKHFFKTFNFFPNVILLARPTNTPELDGAPSRTGRRKLKMERLASAAVG